MDTRSRKSVSIDLFNLPHHSLTSETQRNHTWTCHTIITSLMGRIPDCWIGQTEWNSIERPWMVITGFQLKIPYLEHAFGTKYFIMDQVTGSMMGIYDDKVEQIDLKGQLKPFNINQLDRVMHILGQRRLGV